MMLGALFGWNPLKINIKEHFKGQLRMRRGWREVVFVYLAARAVLNLSVPTLSTSARETSTQQGAKAQSESMRPRSTGGSRDGGT